MSAASEDPERALDEWVRGIVEANRGLNFIQRLMDPHRKTLPLGPGVVGTHLMSWSEDEEGPFVYPNIIEISGGLMQLTPRDAARYAVQNKQLIRFKDKHEADLFSREYKRYVKGRME